MSKYGAKKVVITDDGTLFYPEDIEKFKLDIQGTLFDSEMEGEYFRELQWMKRDGAITEIVCHPRYVLQQKPKITYTPDFLITFTDGKKVAIDVKGVETSTFSVKRRLFTAKFPELELRLITRHHGRWELLKDVKKEKSANKRALNKLIKKAKEKGRTLHERQQ